MATIKMGDDEYEYYPQASVAASKIIADMYVRLGRPTDPFTKSGKKMVEIIIAVWEDLYPKESRAWYASQQDYKKNELDNSTKVSRRTGRSLASVPTPVYQMMKKVFPTFKMNNRDDFLKLVKAFPVFQTTKKL